MKQKPCRDCNVRFAGIAKQVRCRPCHAEFSRKVAISKFTRERRLLKLAAFKRTHSRNANNRTVVPFPNSDSVSPDALAAGNPPLGGVPAPASRTSSPSAPRTQLAERVVPSSSALSAFQFEHVFDPPYPQLSTEVIQNVGQVFQDAARH